MDSFEDLGLTPELIEALAAEGIEQPTPLQAAAIPMLRRGNHLVLAAGPGSGLFVAWAAPLLERIPAEGGSPRILVLTATSDAAERLAESVAQLAQSTGHTVAGLGSSWVVPERAHVLLGTPGDVWAAASESRVSLGEVDAIVVDQAQLIEALGFLGDVERVIDFLGAETQKILSALPMTPGTSDLTERHFRRAMTLPSGDEGAHDSPKRGTVRFRIAPEPREEAVLDIVAGLLNKGESRHALVFCRNEDRAADVGDYLTLHGFLAGAPGDEAVPVWLGVDALAARSAIERVDGVTVVSCDAPADPDSLDRRHSLSEGGVVIVLPREVAHLRALAKQTGYDVVPFPPEPVGSDALAELRGPVERALEEEDLAPYLLALEPLFELHDPMEVAAAAVALWRRKAGKVAANSPGSAKSAPTTGTGAPSWSKLFIGVGDRDGLRAGDLLGAITGEAGVPGDAVGKIDIKESHTLVEVHDTFAHQVIKAINGTTIRGRAVRADFDRPKRGGGGRRPRS